MEELPEPPAPENLARTVEPDLVAVTVVTPFFRIHPTGGPHPSRWDALRTEGPMTAARFDHHEPGATGRAIGYVALALRTCMAEVFQDTRVVDTARRAPWLVAFRVRRTVRLLDLAGRWPTRAGAGQAISSGRRDRARAWSKAIHAAYPEVEGLWYRSSMDGGEPAVAIYERAADALPSRPALHLPLADPALRLPLERAAAELGYLVV